MIPVTSWALLLWAAEAHDLRVFEPQDRCDFFVYVPPYAGVEEADLRSNYHLHVFLESNNDQVRAGQQVSIRISSILPKTTFAGGAVRPDLVNVPSANWETTVAGMQPPHRATELAAARFSQAVNTVAAVAVPSVYGRM